MSTSSTATSSSNETSESQQTDEISEPSRPITELSNCVRLDEECEAGPVSTSKSKVPAEVFDSLKPLAFSPVISFDENTIIANKSASSRMSEIVAKEFKLSTQETSALGAALRGVYSTHGDENDISRFILDKFFVPYLFRATCSNTNITTSLRGGCQVLITPQSLGSTPSSTTSTDESENTKNESEEPKKNHFFEVSQDKKFLTVYPVKLLKVPILQCKPDLFAGFVQFRELSSHIKAACKELSLPEEVEFDLSFCSIFYELNLSPHDIIKDYWYSTSYVSMLACIYSVALSLAWKEKHKSDAWFSFPVVIGVLAGDLYCFREISVVPSPYGYLSHNGMQLMIKVRDIADPDVKGARWTPKHVYALRIPGRERLLSHFVLPLYQTLLSNYKTILKWLDVHSTPTMHFEGIEDEMDVLKGMSVRKFTPLDNKTRNQVLFVDDGSNERIYKMFSSSIHFHSECVYLQQFYETIISAIDGEALTITMESLPPVTTVAPNTAEELLKDALGFAGELNKIHAGDVAHFDIKPSNMYKKGQSYYILDGEFAQCAKYQRAPGGSASYAAPELLPILEGWSDCGVDGRACDVYSLGLSIIALWSKHFKKPKEDMDQQLNQLDNHNKGLADLLRSMVHEEANKRPTIGGVLQTLAQL